MAKWVVIQRCGFYTVNLFVREDCKDVVAKLNVQLRVALGNPSAALNISCWVVRRFRGRVLRDSQMRISLTPELPRKPTPYQQRRASAAASASSTTSPPLADSWAGRVLDGVRRAAPTTNLDHRPRKQQKPATGTASPRAGSAPVSSAPSGRPLQQHTQSPPSAPQTRQPSDVGLSGPPSRGSQEPQLPPALAALRKMVEDSNRRIDSLLDVPRQIHALSGRLGQMEAASTASTTIMTGMQTRIELLACGIAALCDEFRRVSGVSFTVPSTLSTVPVVAAASAPGPPTPSVAMAGPQEPSQVASNVRQPAATEMSTVTASQRSTDSTSLRPPQYDSRVTQTTSAVPLSAHAGPARDNGSAARHG